MYGTGSAHYTRAYIETGHKESFLSFFPSLVHSSILHLPFVSPFLFAHFHFYARHYSLSHSHPVFYSLSHSHFSTFSPFASFEHRSSPLSCLPSIVHPRLAFDRLYRSLHGFRPLSSLLLPLAYLPSHSQPRSLSLAPTLFLCSISFTGKSEATGSYVACGFTSAFAEPLFVAGLLLAGRSIGHVARFGRGFHFQKNPDRTIPLESWVKHRTRLHLSTWFPIIDSNQPFPTTRPSILSRINK